MINKPLISVVIPTYNRKNLLKSCLLALFSQTFPKENFEIIVVDDGSNDSTKSLINSLQKKYSNLRYFWQVNSGVCIARNLGLRHARGKIIAFTDDDCPPQKNWLREIDNSFRKHPQALGIEGKTTTYPEKITPLTAYIVNLKGGGFQTCNMAYKKTVLKKIGGFDENFPKLHCQDVELALRVKKLGTIIFTPKAIVIHPPRKTFLKNELGRIKRIPAEFRLFLKHPDYFAEKYGRSNYFLQIVFINSIRTRLFHLKFFSHWWRKNLSLYSLFFLRTVLEISLIIVLIPKLWRVYQKMKHDQENCPSCDFPEEKNSCPGSIKISVIISTFNRSRLLNHCLRSLLRQTYPPEKFEILVCDDGSSDNTEYLVESRVKKQKNLRYLYQKNQGPAVARNLGIGVTQGKIIAFTDDDCFPQKDWLAQIEKAFNENPKALGVEGKTLTYPTKITPFTSQIINTEGGGYQTCNMAYKKSVLQKIKGFDAKFKVAHCEDVDMALRVLKYGQIIFLPKAIVIHPPHSASFLSALYRIKYIYPEFHLFLKHPDYFYQKYGKGNIFWRVVFINSIWIRLFHLKLHFPWLKKNPLIYLKFMVRTMLEIALIILSIPQFYLSYKKLEQLFSSSSTKQQKLNR